MTCYFNKIADPVLNHHLFPCLSDDGDTPIDKTYIWSRDFFSCRTVCKRWRDIEWNKKTDRRIWQEIARNRLPYSVDLPLENFKQFCLAKFNAMAANLAAGRYDTDASKKIGRHYDWNGRYFLWKNWFFTCPVCDMIIRHDLRTLAEWNHYMVPPHEGVYTKDIRDFQVAHGKIVAKGVPIGDRSESHIFSFHVWDIATGAYRYWKIDSATHCSHFQILNETTLALVIQEGKVILCCLDTGDVKTKFNKPMPDPQAFANNHRNVFVGIGRTVRVFDQESGKHCNDFQLESQVTYLSVYQEKLIIGCQSGPPALLDLKHSTIHRLEIASQLDQQAKLGLDIMQVAPATYVRFMDKLVQSADNRHRIYDLSTMQHVHSFFYSGTVAGHLFNGCLAFILKSQSNANEGGKRYTFSLNTLSLGEELQTTPAIAFVEDKKSVSPVVLEEKKAIAAPDLLPIAHALPAPPPAAPSLLSQLFSCVSDACTQFFNWLCSCFRF